MKGCAKLYKWKERQFLIFCIAWHTLSFMYVSFCDYKLSKLTASSFAFLCVAAGSDFSSLEGDFVGC